MSRAVAQRVIGLYVDRNRADARALATRVETIFREAGYDVRADGVPLDGARALITVGGDGTLLRGARLAIGDDVPLLGINAGRLGFLTELDGDDPRVERLPEALAHEVQIEERLALQAEFGGESYFALNDVVVRKGGVSRIVPFALRMDDENVAHVPADGICVSTPTGSTAYFLSAGGSIVSPRVDAIGVVPLLPHTLFSRPLIVPANSRIEITCDSEIVRANLECDGDAVAELAPGDTVRIVRHPKSVRFARLQPLRFFERLEKKLRWGVSIKQTPSR